MVREVECGWISKPIVGRFFSPALWLPLLSLALVSQAGCCRSELKGAWERTLAQSTLKCIHPTGIFDSAKPATVRCEGGACEIEGTIYWRGRATDANYTTRVRLRAAGGDAAVYILEDSAILPAIPSCRVPVPPC